MLIAKLFVLCIKLAGLAEAQSRNDEMALIETVAMQRETVNQLKTVQGQLALAKERENQYIEKAAHLSTMNETMEATIKQLTEDLKGSKTEMGILKEHAANQEALYRSSKLEYLRKVDDMNEKYLTRNKDIDMILQMIGGRPILSTPEGELASTPSQQKEIHEKQKEIEEKQKEIEEKQKEIDELKQKVEADEKTIKELSEYPTNISPFHEYYLTPVKYEVEAQKVIADFQDMVAEIRSHVCEQCRSLCQ